MKLNVHFRQRHPALKCTKSDKTFSTPSGLDRHKYTHLEPRHSCTECRAKFYFLGELKQHKTIHRKIPVFVYNRGKCDKYYMNHADLLKHVRTHTAEPINCDKCKYSTMNKRLFKSHQKLHTDEEPYSSDVCNRTFKHQNQL